GGLGGVGGDEDVAGVIAQVGVGGRKFVDSSAVLDPFEIDHLAGPILRGVLGNFELVVGDEISVGAPALASGPQRLGLNRRMVKSSAASGEKRAGVIGE